MDVKIFHIEDTTLNIDSGKRSSMLYFDTDKDHLGYILSDGSTYRHILTMSDTDDPTHTLGSFIFKDTSFVGLGSGKGRLEFNESTTDVISIESARLGINSSAPGSLLGINQNTNIDNVLLEIGYSAGTGDGTTRTSWMKYFATQGASDTTWATGTLGERFKVTYLGARATLPSAGTDILTITKDGEVGINSDTPGATLGIDQDTNIDNLLIEIGYSAGTGDGTTRTSWMKYFATQGASDTTWATGASGERFKVTYLGARATLPSAGTDILTITKDGAIGINNDSPDSVLHAQSASAGSVTAPTGSIITAESDQDVFISVLGTDVAEKGIFFGAPTDNDHTKIYVTDSNVDSRLTFEMDGNVIMSLRAYEKKVMIGYLLSENTVDAMLSIYSNTETQLRLDYTIGSKYVDLSSNSNGDFQLSPSSGKASISASGHSPSATLDIRSTGSQLITAYDSTHEVEFAVDSSGNLNIIPKNVCANANVGINSASPPSTLTVGGDVGIPDGMSAPASSSGVAKIYIDNADGDLKVIYADGTVRVLRADSAIQTGYTTFSNLSTDRTLDVSSTTLAEVANVLGTLIEDLKAEKVISA